MLHFSDKTKGWGLTILLVITLVLIANVRIPADNIVMKIKYQSPSTGTAQLFWQSDNEEFTYERYEEEIIVNGTERFRLLDSFDGLCLEITNDQDALIVKSICLYADGFPYKILKGKTLEKYIKNTVNLSQKKIKGNCIIYNSDDQINRIEFDNTFCMYIADGFKGVFNCINILWMIVATIIYILIIVYGKFIKKTSSNLKNNLMQGIGLVLVCMYCIGTYTWRYVCKKNGISEYPNWYFLTISTLVVIEILIICRKHYKESPKLSNVIFAELFKGLVASVDVLIIETATGNLCKIMGSGLIKNIFLIYVLINVSELIVQKPKIIIQIIALCCFLFGVTSYYVMQFRGTPFVPWDLKVISTAATVSQTYSFELDIPIICAMLMCVLNILLINYVIIQDKRNRTIWVIRCLILSLCIIDIVHFEKNIASLWDLKFTFENNGSLTSYISYIQYMYCKAPKGYTDKKAEETLEKTKTIVSGNLQAKNVIIIMNESFSDLRVINDQIIGNEYMPNIDRLQENTIKGNLYVPVFGAGTCNTEFEVLTGVSTSTTPSTPYVTAISSSMDSLSWYYRERGFETYAFHPYLIENWNRGKVYPLLGFQNIYDQSNMENVEYEGAWPSDLCDYDEIISLYEENGEKNFFMFNVTIQNHGGYDYEYSNRNVDLSQYGSYEAAENYLSLLKQSDIAFEKLLHYFSNVKEPTLICMFGDHQPALGDEFYELLYGKKLDELSEEEKNEMYITPFIIWTNYDMNEKNIDKISSNFLGDLIIKASGQNLEGYSAFNYSVFEKYPVVFNRGVYNSQGKFYGGDKNIKDDLLEQYKALEYYKMNRKYR